MYDFEYSMDYYARNEQERQFDKKMKSAVFERGTNAERALYMQNQVILNMLRRIDDSIRTKK